jgi:hypothetical protein
MRERPSRIARPPSGRSIRATEGRFLPRPTQPIYVALPLVVRARSSAGEHYVDIVGVAGSIPAAPTIALAKSCCAFRGRIYLMFRNVRGRRAEIRHREFGSARAPDALRLFLVARRPHALPRIGYGAALRREPFHRGLIFRIDLLGIELELLLSVLGWGSNRNAGGPAGGSARLAVSGKNQQRGHGCGDDGSHPGAPVLPSTRALMAMPCRRCWPGNPPIM